MERLDKLLGSTGKWTRREAKILIHAGRVLVDGNAVRNPAQKVPEETASVCVDGQRVIFRRFTWVMLNKPEGYLSATEDGHGPVVLELLPPDNFLDHAQ